MASFKAISASKKLLIPGDDERKPFLMRFTRGTVILDVMGTLVAFSKTSRSQTYTDSREPKKRLSEWDVREELHRMLGKEEGDKAMTELSV